MVSMVEPGYRGIVTPGWVRDRLWARAQRVPTLDLRFAANRSLRDAVTGRELVTFTRASSATVVGPTGLIETLGNDVPRFQHDPTTGECLGLLVEEARTNSIRNNTMVGAVAGTPGTLPTNWTQVGGTGLTREIVGTGTENGISYIDIKFSGTTGTTFTGVYFDQIMSGFLTGTAYTASVYVKRVAGSTSNLSNLGQYIRYNLTPSGQTDITRALATLNGPTDALINSRFTTTGTTTGTLSGVAGVFVLFSHSSGVAVDITLRLGLPQVEAGAFATSPIPTTAASATRSADIATITGVSFSSWYNQGQGTVFCNSVVSQGLASFPWLYNITDGTTTNSIGVYQFTNGIYSNVASGGVSSSPDATNLFSPSSGAALRHAFAVRPLDTRAATNGTLSAAQTSTVMPISVSTLSIGQRVTGSRMTGTIARLTYWNTRLPDATLQDLTA